MNMPRLNWFGGMLVTRSLLEWTKAAMDDDSPESLISKLNRPNFIHRVMYVTQVINAMGTTIEAARMIQAEGRGFFNDVSAEALASKLEESVAALRNGGIYKFRVAEFGSLNFHGADATESQTDAAD